MSQENRFVTVETYINPWDAQISRALLESEGIPATLGSEHHISIYWPMALVLGGVRVVVPVCMLTPALAVLEERDQGVLQTALEEHWPPEASSCLSCGGTQCKQRRDRVASLMSIAMLFFWGAPFPPRKLRECRECGATRPA